MLDPQDEMINITPMTKEKLELKTPLGDLKLYFATVQGGAQSIEVAEDVKAVMAYDDNTALELIRKDYPAGVAITVRKRAIMHVSEILGKVKVPEHPVDATSILPALLEVPPPKKKTVKDFVYGMMLLAEEYVTNPRDKASIKRIISKLEYGDEAIGVAEGKDA